MNVTGLRRLIALGTLAVVALLLVWSLRPESSSPPQKLVDILLREETTSDEDVNAAYGLLQHGRMARAEIRHVLIHYGGDDPEVTEALLQAATTAREWRSLPRVFELMEHPDLQIRGRAGATARVIMGADFDFRAAHSPRRRAASIAMMKAEYEIARPVYEELYGN